MAAADSDADEGVTAEEIAGTELPGASSEARMSKSRNAFAELMKPKPKAQPKPSPVTRVFKSRDGLGAYITDPSAFPSSSIIYSNDDFVAIRDLYPKSSVHCLLLPRSASHNLQHPYDAFEDPVFLASVQAETVKLKGSVAKELQRLFGRYSRRDAEREAVLNGEAEPPEPGKLPPGRDWEAEVKVGIHGHPSMNHLHIHVISRDMYSPCLKHRKHYNSFNTPFFVDVAEFPLAEDDPRRHPTREGYMNQDLVCWRCGKNFKNKFKELKDHLAVEFEVWKRE